MKKITCFLISIVSTTFLYSQTQIGSDIDGEAALDQSGFSVDLSSDGTVIAIGAINNLGENGFHSGHVRVYENISDTWSQIGSDIDGEFAADRSGNSISLSSDGNIIAIAGYYNDGNGNGSGHVRVYENMSGIWSQIGNDIDGESVNDFSGYSLSTSSDGVIIAVGTPFNGSNRGHVRVYENIDGIWTQIGADIDGEAVGDFSGNSISLSSNGNTLAVGASGNDGNGNGSGHVRVYENISDTWSQIGSDIDGEAVGDESGFSVSLSSNGNMLAVGAVGNNDNTGHVRVYEKISGTWTQIGADIDGEAVGDESGVSVSLSSNGSVVAIGASDNDGENGSDSGHVRVYKYISGIWTQVGSDLDGEAANDFSSYSLSLSSNGSIVAIGAPLNDGENGSDSGHVRVYDLTAVLSTKSFEKDYFSYYPNPVQDILNINLKKGLDLKRVNIYNIQSQYLYSVKTQKIDVSDLSSGIYFIEVETNQGKSAKKIVIN